MNETTTSFACPICESHQSSDYIVLGYGSHPGGVQNFPVLRCRRHGVEFADAPPLPVSPESQKQSLDNLYGTAVDLQTRYVDFMDRVEAVVGRPSGGLLHDVGCGNGQFVFEARRRGWHVQGNDIIAAVKPHLDRNGIRCMIGNISELDLRAESCDVVTSFCVLPHHLTNPTPEMHAVYRLLKPGGWFVLQFPVDGPFRRVGKMISKMFWPRRSSALAGFILANLYGPGGHQFAYTRGNLAEYLRKCGFGEVIFAPYYPALWVTVARFDARPFYVRAPAYVAVALLRIAARALRWPNHAIAYARRAAGTGLQRRQPADSRMTTGFTDTRIDRARVLGPLSVQPAPFHGAGRHAPVLRRGRARKYFETPIWFRGLRELRDTNALKFAFLAKF